MPTQLGGRQSGQFSVLVGQKNFADGQKIIITCPITSMCNVACDATVILDIWEGSVMPGHGDLMATYEKAVHFEAGETKEVEFSHKCNETAEFRRDVGVTVVVDSVEVESEEWDDLFHVAKPEEAGVGWQWLILGGAVVASVVLVATTRRGK